MGFEDFFRLSAHAVITNPHGRVLLLKATYGACDWGLPGGALDPGETVHEGLLRECAEELGCDVVVQYLSGVYHHRAVSSHALVFRCSLPSDAVIRLSEEHSEFSYQPVAELPPVQRRRVLECLTYEGTVRSASF
jgi:8-oxo-dGTP diphosphatase